MSLTLALDLARARPHDFTLQYPPRREYFRQHFRTARDLSALRSLRRVLLYVHVPFCETRCAYCNFAVDIRKEESLHHRYIDGLRGELERLPELLAPDCAIGGIDIGGGTPTLLSTRPLGRLLDALRPWQVRADIPHPLSIETTPRIAADFPERLSLLSEWGVSRVSMGVQSTDDSMLSLVRRTDQAGMVETATANLRRAGFRRVNVDLIFALPGQTRQQWQADLERVVALPIDSVTTYDCLYRGKGRSLTDAPGPEVYGELYDLAFEFLTAQGFHAPYGSVNFSKHSGETGTSPYFEGRLLEGWEYIGVGNYASSLVGDCWWFAPVRVNDWLQAVEEGNCLPCGDFYRLPVEERMAKYLLLSLSFGFVDPRRFRALFAMELDTVFADGISQMIDRKWMRWSEERLTLSPGAFRHLPEVRALFYSRRAMEWCAAVRSAEWRRTGGTAAPE